MMYQVADDNNTIIYQNSGNSPKEKTNAWIKRMKFVTGQIKEPAPLQISEANHVSSTSF